MKDTNFCCLQRGEGFGADSPGDQGFDLVVGNLLRGLNACAVSGIAPCGIVDRFPTVTDIIVDEQPRSPSEARVYDAIGTVSLGSDGDFHDFVLLWQVDLKKIRASRFFASGNS
jgi:hypothetical protein